MYVGGPLSHSDAIPHQERGQNQKVPDCDSVSLITTSTEGIHSMRSSNLTKVQCFDIDNLFMNLTSSVIPVYLSTVSRRNDLSSKILLLSYRCHHP